MAKHMLFPDVGEGITEGVLVKWLVQEGDAVKEDQPLAEIETDKAVVEIPSQMHGTVLKLYGKAGDTLKVHTPLVTIGNPGEPVPPLEEKIITKTMAATAQAPSTQTTASTAPALQEASSGAILAPPSVRALARQLGVELGSVKGTGPGGRITAEDVQRIKSAAVGSYAVPPKKLSFDLGKGKRLPLTHLRKTIAERMQFSWQQNAHVTYVEEADFTFLLSLRERRREAAEKQGIKLTPLAFIMKALVETLKDHPVFNASLDEEKQELVLHDYYNIAVGVDTEEGLIAPVLKNVESKNILQIAKEMRELSDKARTRKLGLDEIRGGTFTVTNLGSVGGVFASAVINPPECAILGIYRTRQRVVVEDGRMVMKPMTYLGLTFDHRISDGAAAARFMNEFVQKLQEPNWMEEL